MYRLSNVITWIDDDDDDDVVDLIVGEVMVGVAW